MCYWQWLECSLGPNGIDGYSAITYVICYNPMKSQHVKFFCYLETINCVSWNRPARDSGSFTLNSEVRAQRPKVTYDEKELLAEVMHKAKSKEAITWAAFKWILLALLRGLGCRSTRRIRGRSILHPPLVSVLSRQYMAHGPGSKKGKNCESLKQKKKTDLHII